MPRFIVHIGTHKTGTTTIQHTLNAATEAVRAEGITWIPATVSFQAWGIGSSTVEAYEQRRARLHDAIAVADTPVVLISDEGLSGTLESGYTDARQRAESLRDLVGDDEVSIVVYLRQQQDFVQSAYVQAVQTGSSSSFAEYLDALPPESFDWLSLLKSYAQIFGRESIVVRTYDKARLQAAGGIVREFAGIIGSSSLPSFEVAPRNQSYNRQALEVARICNSSPMDASDQRTLRRLLQKASFKSHFEAHTFWASEVERSAFNAKYTSSNAMVAAEWIGSPQTELFASGDPKPVSGWTGLSLEDAVRVQMLALLEMRRELLADKQVTREDAPAEQQKLRDEMRQELREMRAEVGSELQQSEQRTEASLRAVDEKAELSFHLYRRFERLNTVPILGRLLNRIWPR